MAAFLVTTLSNLLCLDENLYLAQTSLNMVAKSPPAYKPALVLIYNGLAPNRRPAIF